MSITRDSINIIADYEIDVGQQSSEVFFKEFFADNREKGLEKARSFEYFGIRLIKVSERIDLYYSEVIWEAE